MVLIGASMSAYILIYFPIFILLLYCRGPTCMCRLNKHNSYSGGWGSNSQEKNHYLTLEWPLRGSG